MKKSMRMSSSAGFQNAPWRHKDCFEADGKRFCTTLVDRFVFDVPPANDLGFQELPGV
jgi:hypothetical protein